MRTVTVVLLLTLAAFAVAADMLINDQDLINRINTNPKSSWKAQAHKVFEGKTFTQMKRMLGGFLPLPETDHIPRYSPKVTKAIPDNFDQATQWPKCVFPIRDQQHCGSCWAVSGAEVMSDRFCIASNASVKLVMSPQYILSCDDSNYGCDGGYLNNEWNYLGRVGTVSEECDPYVSGNGVVPKCPKMCKDGSALKMYKVNPKTVRVFDEDNLEAIQEDIMTYGSVQMGFRVYQDFFTYSSGVYRHLHGGLAGGHAVKVTGWGVDSASGLPYWIVANSWGETWGQKGFFWILRGSNECDCESQMWSGQAILN